MWSHGTVLCCAIQRFSEDGNMKKFTKKYKVTRGYASQQTDDYFQQSSRACIIRQVGTGRLNTIRQRKVQEDVWYCVLRWQQ